MNDARRDSVFDSKLGKSSDLASVRRAPAAHSPVSFGEANSCSSTLCFTSALCMHAKHESM